jgi:hypothetical protein
MFKHEGVCIAFKSLISDPNSTSRFISPNTDVYSTFYNVRSASSLYYYLCFDIFNVTISSSDPTIAPKVLFSKSSII